MGQLIDIQGLDGIPWWPLATGWWIAAGVILLLLTISFLTVRHYLRYPPGSWRNEAQKQLRQLRRARAQLPPKQIAAELSELLRRIAIARHGREGVAALTGKSWLEWLQQNDPNGFVWINHSDLLLKLPYARKEGEGLSAELDILIAAALKMTAKRSHYWFAPDRIKSGAGDV